MEAEVALCEQVLVALRRITRAIDLHSRQLTQSHGLTGPQALILKCLLDRDEISVGVLAHLVNLSQTTVTDILNRLEKRGLVHRVRSQVDRRRVNVAATEKASLLLRNSPPLLQEQFIQRFNALLDWEQALILSTLQRVAGMMDTQELSVSPVLTPGPIPAPPEAVKQMEDTSDAPQNMDGGANADIIRTLQRSR
jgi:DNA-binding MarR family transcriptional regulator